MSRIASLLAFAALLGVLVGRSSAVAAPPEDAVDDAAAEAPAKPEDPPASPSEAEEPAGPPAPAKPEAGPPDAVADAAPDPAPVAPTDPLRLRAARIRALIDGTLGLELDPASLFIIDLSDPAWVGPDGEHLRGLLLQLEAPPPDPEPPRRRPSRRKPKTPEPEPTPEPAAELTEALEAYLRLSPEQRRATFETHARRRDDAVAEREASSRRESRRLAITTQADQLEAFLDGTLDLEIDPRPLLRLNLSDEHETALSPLRRKAWSTEPPSAEPPTEPEPPVEPAEPAEPPTEPEPPASPDDPATELDSLDTAEARLDALRRRFLALTPPERSALFETHERRKKEAEEAEAAAKAQAEAEAKAQADAEAESQVLDLESVAEITNAEAEAEAANLEREKALEEARLARTEATRILANERARLLGIKEDQALLQAELNRRKAERIANHDRALEWQSRVSELADGPLFGTELEQEADGMYEGIRSELATTRTLLREELEHIRAPGNDIPKVGDNLDRDLAEDIDRGEIIGLREEVQRNEQELLTLEQDVSWELAQGLRDDVVRLNRTRLLLLELASPDLHDTVTGFGDRGLDQVQRELDQISVELGFHALKLPRYKDILLELLRGSPFTVAWGVIQLLLVMLGLWWWRRRWPGLLKRLRHLLVRRRPVPRAAMLSLTGLWYLDRIRRPLELLLTLWIVLSLAGELDDLPELILPWIIVRWILIGLAVILLLDAIAARDNARRRRRTADTSKLRIHSLRVVGINVITVGLILSLTSATVGRGAIYSWVISTCWLLSVPVALYLVHRWRPIIAERLAQHPVQGPFVTWARAQQTGWIRFVAATAAAAYLFADGLGRWFMRHLGARETTRRVLAYLFRREVAKQAAASAAATEHFDRVDTGCYQTFDPEFFERKPIEAIGQAEVGQIATLLDAPRSTLSAIIGERGMGKTSVLRRLEKQLGPDRLKVVSCPEIGLEGLMARIAAITGDREHKGSELAEVLRKMGPMAIAIDDAQRLIQPAVRGLRELDRFTAFARDVGGQISWVVCMGSAAWHFLQRARGNRVFFEQVVTLPRWTEEQLGELIRARCKEAKVEPSFEGLVVPRPADPLAGSDGTPDDQRTEAGYYRLLWDFSRGNPAVALHAFRESLFVGPEQKTIVRLFKEPPSKEIESLSLPLMFVLRAVVQLDVAREHELVGATQLPAADVSDALRFCLTRGYVERYDVGVRVAWHWFRTITNVLQRQHLLSP